MSDDGSDVDDPVLKHLEVLKARAEARKAITEATSAGFETVLPTWPGEITGDEQEVSGEDSPLGTGAAYVAFARAANSVAATVTAGLSNGPGQGPTRYWVVTDDRHLRHRLVRDALDRDLDRCQELVAEAERWLGGDASAPPVTGIEQAPPAADEEEFGAKAASFTGAVAIGAIGSFLSRGVPMLASLVRVKRSIHHRDAALSERAVVNEFAQQLRTTEGLRRTVLVAGVTPPDTTVREGQIAELAGARDDLANRLVRYESDKAEDEIARVGASASLDLLTTVLTEQLKKAGPAPTVDDPPASETGLGAAAAALADAASAVARAEQELARRVATSERVHEIIEHIDGFLVAATTPDEDGITPIAAASELDGVSDDTAVVLIEASYAGAESKYEEHLIRNDKAFHSAVVTLTFSATHGDRVVSGTKTLFTPVLHNLSTHQIATQDTTVLDN